MSGQRTRDALLEHGALLFARHGVSRVTARQLHEAVGARNESALHYHFGSVDGLVTEIVRVHLDAVEERRAPLVAAIVYEERSSELRALVHALAAPMAVDLATPDGRAHLRIVAQLSHPSLAYELPFRPKDKPAGATVVKWLLDALDWLPEAIRTERLALLRAQLLSGFGLRAQLLDDRRSSGAGAAATQLFVENMLDMVVAGLSAPPSPEAVTVAEQVDICAEVRSPDRL